MAVRHSIVTQVLVREKYIMIDVTSPLAIWPSEHSADDLVAVLRHFRSVIE